MDIKGSVALVTGANGGIGKAFVTELLNRGATKVYATARNPQTLDEIVRSSGGKVVAVKLDVTDAKQLADAVAAAPDLTLLVNNAGYAAFEGSISASDLDNARQEMEVNYFGPLAVTRAFKNILATNGGGTIVNMLSMVSLVSIPMAATYSASKAAILSVTRSIRAELAAQGTQVVGVLAVQTESEMGSSFPAPRMTPEEVVNDALDAVQNGINDDIPAGAQTRGVYDAFVADPKGLQAQLLNWLPKAS